MTISWKYKVLKPRKLSIFEVCIQRVTLTAVRLSALSRPALYAGGGGEATRMLHPAIDLQTESRGTVLLPVRTYVFRQKCFYF